MESPESPERELESEEDTPRCYDRRVSCYPRTIPFDPEDPGYDAYDPEYASSSSGIVVRAWKRRRVEEDPEEHRRAKTEEPREKVEKGPPVVHFWTKLQECDGCRPEYGDSTQPRDPRYPRPNAPRPTNTSTTYEYRIPVATTAQEAQTLPDTPENRSRGVDASTQTPMAQVFPIETLEQQEAREPSLDG